MNSISISRLIDEKYREYWEYSNKNGKNSIVPKEQLPEVIRKIIYSAYKINLQEGKEKKTIVLKSEVSKYHAHGDSSIEESIKGVATAYKSQPAIRILEGIGNFGAAPGDEGAAARYTSISGTPLLKAIYEDIPFVPTSVEDTGVEQPVYISCPLPMALIAGASPIGTGKSCYVAEREAKSVIGWIDELRKNEWSTSIEAPQPISVTGCKTWFEPSNGYVYYQANIHYGVDRDDITKKGKYDIITELPPKSTPGNVIIHLQAKMPPRITDRIMDGSGRGKATYIILPKGYLEEKDFNKYSLRSARKEQIFIWCDDKNTMKKSNIHSIAKGWFDDRCQVVIKRFQKAISVLEVLTHKIDLIRIYAENGMTNWKSEEIVAFYQNLDAANGADDASTVLSQTARAFLPENLAKNEITKINNAKEIKALNKKINDIGNVVISEAYEIIEKQEKFFAE